MTLEVYPGARLGGRTLGGARRITVTNPATGTEVASVAAATATEAGMAVDDASTAYPGWSAQPAADRARHLRAVAEALRIEPVDGLPRLISLETGKRLAEAEAEVAFSAAFFDWFAHAVVALPDAHLTLAGREFVVAQRPLGVIAALTPWNFPVSIPARKVAAALAAGCTVILKPSELSPLSGLRFTEIVQSNLPDGCLTTVVGDGEELTNALVDDPRVSGVSFTGSTRVGSLVAGRCAPTFKRTVMELGGRAPFIICEDADPDVAVEALVIAKFRNNGMSCIAANNVFIHETMYRQVLEMFVGRIQTLRVGDPVDPSTELGPVITRDHVLRLQMLIDEARSRGGTVVAGDAAPSTGFFVTPTVVEATEDMALWNEEIFGPVAAIKPYVNDQRLIEEVNSWSAGLGGFVCSRDIDHAIAIAKGLQIGIVGINNGAPNTPEVPFGGFKQSGRGREGGIEGIIEFCESQTLSIAVT